MYGTLLLATAAAALDVRQQSTDPDSTSNVYLAQDTGGLNHYAAGTLYGIPTDSDQIPGEWFTNMGYSYSRGGGVTATDGGKGWLSSFEDYQARFDSVLAQYRSVRRFGAKYNIQMADIWGADGGQSQTDGPYPGDNGNWTSYDNYLVQLVADLKANDAIEGITFDLWNEPNGDIYWNRPQQQYFDMWGHSWHYLKGALPDNNLNGPAANSSPLPGDEFWEPFVSFVSQNQSVPDEWVWHILADQDLVTKRTNLYALLDEYSLPHNPIVIDEYGLDYEQTPVFGAWYIAQFERINSYGLRCCWMPGPQTFDLIDGLLTKPGAANLSTYNPNSTDYQATGQYLVFQYYGSTMTGNRVATNMSANGQFDVYATVDGNSLKMLYGSKQQTAPSYIQINDLDTIGLASSGTAQIHSLSFPFPGGFPAGRYVAVDAATDLGTVGIDYTNNTLIIP